MPKHECPLFDLEGPQHAEYTCDQCEINELTDDLDAAYRMIILLMKQREWGAATGALYGDPVVKAARRWVGV